MRSRGRTQRERATSGDGPSLFGLCDDEDDKALSASSAGPFEVFGFSSEAAWPDRFGESLRRLVCESGLRPIRTLSLFTGAGGLDIGFHDAGFEVGEMVEIEERYVETLRHNSRPGRSLESGTPRHMDVRDYQAPPEGRYEFIIGGPPCQTFSAAGRRASGVSGLHDKRGTLFEEYVRILKAVKPAGFLFENVYGITGANGGAAWKAIQAAFAAAGYQVFHRILDAADYGVPQHRERLFIVGVRAGKFLFPRPTHGPDSRSGRRHFVAGAAVAGAAIGPETPRSVGGRYGRLLVQIPPGLNYSFFTENMGHPRPVFAWRSKFSDFLYKADPAAPVRTLKAQGGQYTGPFHWGNRPFSVGEFKRLQTFPDAYTLVGGRQAAIQMIGNSVPPQLARMLAITVRTQVFGERWPFVMELLDEIERLRFRQRKRLLTQAYQRKATEALTGIPDSLVENRPTLSGRTYHARLTDQFAFEAGSPRENGYRIDFRVGATSWSLGVLPEGRAIRGSLRITVAPVPGRTWGLPAKCVRMTVGVNEDRAFTVAWKAFEAEVIRGGYKADLVQLCNYYQYPAAFRPTLTVEGDLAGTHWKVLAALCSGEGVAQTSEVERLSNAWRVSVQVVHSTMRWLRQLGYEVRNHRTNSEIPEGCYLVPYSFPTLSPQSVQLRKSLD